MRFVPERFFLPVHGVPGLHDVLWWTLATTIAVLSAMLVWMAVTPVSPLGDWRPAGVRVMSPAARSALFAGFDPFNRANRPAQPSGVETVTSLALTLFGIRTNAATGGGSAIIAGADGVQDVYGTGDEVMAGVTLAGVAFDHVKLSHNGNIELLYLDQSKPAPSAAAVVAAAPVPVMPPPPAAAAAGPLTVEAVQRGIAFSPRNENGKLMGLEVNSSADGSAFSAAGFKAGDVIVAAGGKPITNMEDAAALRGSLKPGSSVSVIVQRGNERLPLSLTLGQ